MKFNTPRSIKTPIILGASSIALSIALLVGWILVLIQNSEQAEQAARANGWLMVGGISSFVVIVIVLVIFSVFLVREILESPHGIPWFPLGIPLNLPLIPWGMFCYV